MLNITETDILELLELNQDKWLTSKTICKLLGIKETCTLRGHINKLRTHGEPIISNNQGYKLADNCLDYVDFLERFSKRNSKMSEAYEGMSQLVWIGEKIIKK